MTYKVKITPSALKMLRAIADRRIQAIIRDRIDGLAQDPAKQGKPLVGEWHGYRSLRAAGQRYRIIYRIDNDAILVFVVMVGIRKEGDRKDVYALAKKLIKLGLLESEKTEE